MKNIKDYDIGRTRIRKRNKPFKFKLLAHALAKYDYFGAPKYKHAWTIMRWTRFVLKRNYSEIPTLIRTDLRGKRIPDAFNVMIDYFT